MRESMEGDHLFDYKGARDGALLLLLILLSAAIILTSEGLRDFIKGGL